MRLVDLLWRGQLGLLIAGDVRSLLVLLEFGLMLAPVVMLRSAASRRDLGHLVRAAIVMMFGRRALSLRHVPGGVHAGRRTGRISRAWPRSW